MRPWSIAGLREEAAAQVHRWSLWTPVAFGLGCAGYFQLRIEPPLLPLLALAILTAALAALAARWGRSRALFIALSLIAFASAGFLAAKVRTLAVAAPVAPSSGRPLEVEGWVVDVVSPGATGGRLLIAPVSIAGVAPRDVPRRLRASVKPDALFGPGSAIRFTGLLNPPPAPASPGAYDFARDAFHQQIGGSALVLTPPTTIALPRPPWRFRLLMAVNAARWSLARRIVADMPAPEGGIAAAMTTGHEAWISREETDVMRDSGLAHILSISGLHMAIVGGFVFFAARLLIAAWPWAALRVSGKKVAAGAAMTAILVYLVISGWPPPAQRSAITAGIAFLAVLLDRRALSLHALATAALVVMALQPEAVVQPGFQMSFAATAALLALAESWPRGIREIKAPLWILAIQRTTGWLWAAVAASFVASAATTPFAVQHFNRVTLYGLPANLAVEPLSSFVVMPALALGAVAEAVGLPSPFLDLAGWGLNALDAVARFFAAAPRAVAIVASAPNETLAVSFVGLLFICLWRGKLRWLGLPVFLTAMLWPRSAPPAVWVAGGGANAALSMDGKALMIRPRGQAFAADVWARRRGLTLLDPQSPDREAYIRCTRDVCETLPAAPVRLAIWQRLIRPSPGDLSAMCGAADIVILRTGEASLPACSGKLVLGQAALARGGPAEISRAPEGWRVVWTQPIRGQRPWTALSDSDE